MKEYNNEEEQQINFYKIIFHKHDRYPVGYYSRNLISKKKDRESPISNHKEKNEDYFNPISDDHTHKIQKLYSKFQTTKSATKYERSFHKKKEYSFSRPLSQHTTIGLSKNNSCPYFRSSPLSRPMSQINKNSTIYIDNFPSNNYSKITKYTNNKKNYLIEQKPKLLKNKKQFKNKINRSSSAVLLRQKSDIFNNSSNIAMKNLLIQEEEMKKRKKILRARLLTVLSRHLVINKDIYNYYNYLFKDELDPDEKKLNESINKKINPKKIFHFIKHHPDIFS